MPRTLIDGILASLIVAGIGGLFVLYGDVRTLRGDGIAMRREIDKLDTRSNVHGEAVARLEERIKCGP